MLAHRLFVFPATMIALQTKVWFQGVVNCTKRNDDSCMHCFVLLRAPLDLIRGVLRNDGAMVVVKSVGTGSCLN
jgi:hypothetical protein